MGRTDRWLVAMVGGAVALVVAGFALLLLVVQARSPEILAEDTPAGVVQRYLLALQDGRYDDADQYLAQSLKDWRKKEEERSGRPFPPKRPRPTGERPGTRVVLQNVELRNETAQVTVAVSSFTAPSPTSAQEYTNTATFELRREQGVWKITAPEYPYHFPF